MSIVFTATNPGAPILPTQLMVNVDSFYATTAGAPRAHVRFLAIDVH